MLGKARFVSGVGCLLVVLIALSLNAAVSAPDVLVTVLQESSGVTIPADFLVFSYEKSMLAEPHFRANNAELVSLYRSLGTGVMRERKLRSVAALSERRAAHHRVDADSRR